MLEVGDASEIAEGTALKPSARSFTPEDVTAFCALTGDGADIHQLGEVQIVPGAMLLSAVASYLQGALRVLNASHAVLAKIDDARFPASLVAGHACRFEGTVRRVRSHGGATYVTVAVTCTDVTSGDTVISLDVTDAYLSRDGSHI